MKIPKLTFDRGEIVIPKGFRTLKRRAKLRKGDLWVFSGEWKKTNFVGDSVETGLYIRKV